MCACAGRASRRAFPRKRFPGFRPRLLRTYVRRVRGREIMGDARGLSRDALGDEIATLAAHIHAAMARWLALVAEFDAREGWAAWGCPRRAAPSTPRPSSRSRTR